MADLSTTLPAFRKLDRVWLLIAGILALVAVLTPPDFIPTIIFTLKALGGTAPYIGFAVFMVAYLKASGAEGLVAAAFKGNQVRMVILAAMVGGLAPFCSCEVIPFIAALLAMGVPLAPVMAFWLASPIMDPPMFIITTGALGVDFAVAKTLAAVAFGLLGGFGVMALGGTRLFTDPLRENTLQNGCGCGTDPFSEKPVWAFWRESPRVRAFVDTALSNATFLLKWLTFAYLIEALMVRFVPAEWIAQVLGRRRHRPDFAGRADRWACLSERLCRGTAGGGAGWNTGCRKGPR